VGIIWIRCPATRRKASTGIQTEASSLEEFPSLLKKARCPICGMRHVWEDDDALDQDARNSVVLAVFLSKS
jgi:hypothetical protein